MLAYCVNIQHLISLIDEFMSVSYNLPSLQWTKQHQQECRSRVLHSRFLYSCHPCKLRWLLCLRTWHSTVYVEYCLVCSPSHKTGDDRMCNKVNFLAHSAVKLGVNAVHSQLWAEFINAKLYLVFTRDLLPFFRFTDNILLEKECFICFDDPTKSGPSDAT